MKTCLESAEGPREPGYPSTEGRTPGRMSEGKQDTSWGTEEVQSRMGAHRRKREGGSAMLQFRKRRLRPDLEKIPEGS